MRSTPSSSRTTAQTPSIAAWPSSGAADRVTIVDNSSSTDVRNVTSRHGAEYIDAGANIGFAAGVNLALRPLLDEHAGRCAAAQPRRPALAGRPRPPGAVPPRARSLACRVRRSAARRQRRTRAARDLAFPVAAPHVDGGRRRGARSGSRGLRHRSRAAPAVGGARSRSASSTSASSSTARRPTGSVAPKTWAGRLRSAPTSSPCTTEPARATTRAAAELLFHAAQETYIRKWYGRRGWWAYRAAACAGATARAVALSGDRRAEAARRARLYARGPRRSAGLARG